MTGRSPVLLFERSLVLAEPTVIEQPDLIIRYAGYRFAIRVVGERTASNRPGRRQRRNGVAVQITDRPNIYAGCFGKDSTTDQPDGTAQHDVGCVEFPVRGVTRPRERIPGNRDTVEFAFHNLDRRIPNIGDRRRTVHGLSVTIRAVIPVHVTVDRGRVATIVVHQARYTSGRGDEPVCLVVTGRLGYGAATIGCYGHARTIRILERVRRCGATRCSRVVVIDRFARNQRTRQPASGVEPIRLRSRRSRWRPRHRICDCSTVLHLGNRIGHQRRRALFPRDCR